MQTANEKDNISAPFHLFEYQGCCFAYHQVIDDFILISRDAYNAIHRIAEGRQHIDDIQNSKIRDDIRKLADIGFFQSYETSTLEGNDVERLLERRYKTPWTKLELALSEVCNLACKYCYCGTCRDQVRNQGLMSEDVARQAINWLFAESGQAKDMSITFFGGEPLMNIVLSLINVIYRAILILPNKKVWVECH